MNEKGQKLFEIIKSSAFNINCNYKIDARLEDLFTAKGVFASFNDKLLARLGNETLTNNEIIASVTPEFQRENTKWSQHMQIQFMENLVCGHRTNIQMFEIAGGSEMGDCSIIDGLQRTTSMGAFHSGEFKIFGEFDINDVLESPMLGRIRIDLSIYSFNSPHEAVDFYIKMNKGITHSESDLESAYAYLANLPV
jgi:hypothetical protein